MQIVLFVTVTFLAQYGCAQKQRYYKAAVVEFAPYEGKTTPDQILKQNVLKYLEFIKTASDEESHIIVFPEDGITGIAASNLPLQHIRSYSVEVVENTLPCTDKADKPNFGVLRNISCSARDNHIYVVVNLIEQEDANSSITFYNTDVVFSTDGSIIAKYRKINLYYEPGFTAGKQVKTFKTDFNVTFGIFTCFDILFKNPALDVLSNPEVTDIIYPSAWFSETPYLASLSTQAGYARANGVNLLSAGYNRPQEKNGGSGIFFANGTFAEVVITTDQASRLIISEVPILAGRTPPRKCSEQKHSAKPETVGAALNGFNTYKEDLSNYTLEALEELHTQKTVCSGKEFCCAFDVTLKEARKSNNYFYKLAVHDGTRHLGPVIAGIRSCGVLACVTEDPRTCADRSSLLKPTPFKSIKITSVSPTDAHTFYFPSTLRTSLTPLRDVFYCNEPVNAKKAKISVETVFEEGSLLSFGFYGRVYDRDFYLRDRAKLSGDDWMKIFMAGAAACTVASVLFIFYAQRTDLKLKIT